MSPQRIQMTRKQPWRHLHPDAVIVDRRSKWGNPLDWTTYPHLHMDSEGELHRATKAERRRWAVVDFESAVKYGTLNYPSAEEIRAELAGRDLACWCPPDWPCHADVLLEVANTPAGGAG